MLPIRRFLPLLLLVVLPQTVAGRRPWSLPTNIGRSVRLVERQNSNNAGSQSAPPKPITALGVTGGESPVSEEDLPLPSSSMSDEKKSQKTEPALESAVKNSTTDKSTQQEDASSVAAQNSAALSGGASTTASTKTTNPSTTTSNLNTTATLDENEAAATAKSLEETTPSPDDEKKRKGLKKLLPKKKDKYHKKLAKKLRNRNANNMRRKFMHASFGIFFASLNHFTPKDKFVPAMTILSSATLLMELLRYRKGFGWMNKTLHFVLGKALRKNEMDGKFTGSFYFFTGVTLTAALYPTTCATMGILQLALADPSASYFGRATRHVYWSRIENGLGGFGRNKGILGFLGGAAFCFPFNYRILSIAKFGAEGIPGGTSSLMAASLALGLAGAFADLAVPTPAWVLPKKICGVRVPPLHLDDNFVVPVVSGFACTQIFKALQWDQNLALATFIFA